MHDEVIMREFSISYSLNSILVKNIFILPRILLKRTMKFNSSAVTEETVEANQYIIKNNA